MLEQRDLYEIALAYFKVRAIERPEFERLLIRSRNDAILPMLRALHTVVGFGRKPTAEIARIARRTPQGELFFRGEWASLELQSSLDAAHEVVRRIGVNAQESLCKAILEPDYSLRLLAALLLSMEEHINSDTREFAQVAANIIGTDRRQAKRQGELILLFAIVMLHAEDPKWTEFINSWAGARSQTLEEWVAARRKTALVRLYRSE
ncbi:MAG: hypothetical protein ACRDHP_12340 [Ktedonobacterales bacterium]